MSSRSEILQRLRNGRSTQTAALDAPCTTASMLRLPASDPDSLLQSFREKFRELKGELFECGGIRDSAEILLQLTENDKDQLLYHSSPLLDSLRSSCPQLDSVLGAASDLTASSTRLAEARIGITTADYLSARTGSILLRSGRAGGRRLSVLPPLHIVLARKAQLLPSLQPWLSELAEDSAWSSAVIISGPSRTADIEKILVLGAHGPRRLALILAG